MKKNRIAIAEKTVAADWLSAYHTGHTDRAPGLPLLGLMVGGSVSLLLWTALSLSAWALLLR